MRNLGCTLVISPTREKNAFSMIFKIQFIVKSKMALSMYKEIVSKCPRMLFILQKPWRITTLVGHKGRHQVDQSSMFNNESETQEWWNRQSRNLTSGPGSFE